jgi:hypothetical protein
VRAYLENQGIVKEGQMLDPTDRCGLIAIQHLLEKRGDLGQFTKLVIYATNKTYRTNNEKNVSSKTTIPLGKNGNKSLYIYYDGRGEAGHYYALTPKKPAQPETLSKSETSSSSKATRLQETNTKELQRQLKEDLIEAKELSVLLSYVSEHSEESTVNSRLTALSQNIETLKQNINDDNLVKQIEQEVYGIPLIHYSDSPLPPHDPLQTHEPEVLEVLEGNCTIQ